MRKSIIRERIAAKGKPPAGTLRLVTELLFTEDVNGWPVDEDVAWYLGHDEPEEINIADALNTAVRKSTDARLPLVLLALVAAVAEDNVAAHSTSWRYSSSAALPWFNLLAGLGYALCDAENHLVEQARSKLLTQADNADAA